jgi:CRP/FNR family cyclic AMP-dependent transcriptional regulator
MSDIQDKLSEIDLFAPLPRRVLRKIAEECVTRSYPAGETILRQGEVGLGVFFIERGQVSVRVERDGEYVTVATLGEDEVLGEISILDDKPRSAEVVCTEATDCVLLTRDRFLSLMDRHPELAVQLAVYLSERLRATTERLVAQDRDVSPLTGDRFPDAVSEEIASGPDTVAEQIKERAEGSSPEESSGEGRDWKARTEQSLLDAFSSIYAAQALTRFSVALVGCPVNVTVEAGTPRVTAEHRGIRIFAWPSERPCRLRLDAYADGIVRLATLSTDPSGALTIRREHRAIGRGETRRV